MQGIRFLINFSLVIARILTLPYTLVLWLRHRCYDWGIFNSLTLDIPVLSLGNITAGGTGKTPHTELVLRLFSQDVEVAVLSRGYKRSSKGFRYVDAADSVMDTGDEPLQIKRKFPSVVVAVDTNRIAGIKRILQDYPQIKLIVLDDAFQYRRLKPAYSILLSEYSRPFTQDLLLPFGGLRDLPAQAWRAHMIVVSKSPPSVDLAERGRQQKALCLKPRQHLVFSYYAYGTPQPVFPKPNASGHRKTATHIVALTGVANPRPFIEAIQSCAILVGHLQFSDHRCFTQKDIRQINEAAAQHPCAAIYTTEKDAVRLKEHPALSAQAKEALFYIPLQVDFCDDSDKYLFIKQIRQLLPVPSSPQPFAT